MCGCGRFVNNETDSEDESGNEIELEVNNYFGAEPSAPPPPPYSEA